MQWFVLDTALCKPLKVMHYVFAYKRSISSSPVLPFHMPLWAITIMGFFT